jgi:peptide chain release factor 1
MKQFEGLHQKWLAELKTLQIELEKIENCAFSLEQRRQQSRVFLLEKRCLLFDKLSKLKDDLKSATDYCISEKDKTMISLWNSEIERLQSEIEQFSEEILKKLLPEDVQNVILEIRAGQGGQEASLFAQEIADMYAKLARHRGWKFGMLSSNYAEGGGLKEGVFEINGEATSIWLASESGVHCVKRVPKTEKSGRIHTSTITVAVLPEPTEIEVKIDEKDLKIDVFRSSGPGGQSVNTTDSGVRVTHIPSGLVVSQQDEKSQHKNKEKALKILKARLYQKQLEEAHSKLAQKRRDFVGSAQRNERIRTYHFTQNWVNDTRLSTMSYNVVAFMEAVELEKFLEQLVINYIE